MIEVRPITAVEARTVRHPVLREGLAAKAAILDRDDDPDTSHLGAYASERLVGVATFFPDPCSLRPGRRVWRGPDRTT
ncbi:MAG TPA: hypothetical protein VFB67_11745 [Candidatus Polarisedimenticolaceae bacterium]|nr:hypothetical protein [Candidatus Polarisedimenticolaceae bacterium]